MRKGEKLYNEETITNQAIYFIPQSYYVPEEFRPITDQAVPGVVPYYLISNYGRIWHRYKERFLTVNFDSKGYPFKPLAMRDSGKMKNCRIHRLVMMTFNYFPGCEDMVVDHKDGNKGNPYICNLEWVTQAENTFRAYQNGAHIVNYTDEQIHQVCKLLEDRSKTLMSISDETGVAYTTVQAIQNKRTYVDISDQYNIQSRKINNNLSIEQIHSLCEFYGLNNQLPNETQKQYAERALNSIGIESPSTREIRSAKKIYTKETYQYISCDYNF